MTRLGVGLARIVPFGVSVPRRYSFQVLHQHAPAVRTERSVVLACRVQERQILAGAHPNFYLVIDALSHVHPGRKKMPAPVRGQNHLGDSQADNFGRRLPGRRPLCGCRSCGRLIALIVRPEHVWPEVVHRDLAVAKALDVPATLGWHAPTPVAPRADRALADAERLRSRRAAESAYP